MLDTSRDDEQLSLFELDGAIAELERQVPFEDEEEVVGLVVRCSAP